MAGLAGAPIILDIGCGPGGQTMDIARLTAGHIVGVDMHLPYLIELKRRAAEKNLDGRIHAVWADMHKLGFKEAAFDAVWAEGSIYIIGFERGLRDWKRFIKPGGYIAVTEVAWLKAHPPRDVERYWDEAYPAIRSDSANLKIMEDSGYEIAGHFVLPESAWWNDYYHPIERKLDPLRIKYRDDKEALETIAATQAEIDIFRRFSDYYGYVFYVARTG